MTASACSSWSLVTIRTVSGMVSTPESEGRNRGPCPPSAWLGDDVVDHGVGVHVNLDAQQVERLGLRRAVRAGAQLRLGVVAPGEALADLGVEVAGEQDGLGQLERQRQIRMHDRFLLSEV